MIKKTGSEKNNTLMVINISDVLKTILNLVLENIIFMMTKIYMKVNGMKDRDTEL